MKRKLYILMLASALVTGCANVQQPESEEDTVVSAELEEKEETFDTMEIPPEFDYLSYLSLCSFDAEDYDTNSGYTTQSIRLLERFVYLLSLNTNNGKLDSEEQFNGLYETLMSWSEEALQAAHYDCIALEIQPGKASIIVNIRFVNDRSMSFEIPATFVSEEEVEAVGPTRIGTIDKNWFTEGIMQSVEDVPIHEDFDWVAYCDEFGIDTTFRSKLSATGNNFFRRFMFTYGVYLDGLNALDLETFQNFQASFTNWSGETAQLTMYGVDNFTEKLTADSDTGAYTWECDISIEGEDVQITISDNGLRMMSRV